MHDNARPLISIIIPTYNSGASLEECLLRILALSLHNLEIIVIDGASEDDSRLILEQYSPHLATWTSEPDGGIYDALNKGCRLARGQYLYFLGSDDRLADNFGAITKYLKNQQTIYYGDVILAKTGKRYDGLFSLYKIARTNISHQAIFYPRTVFDTFQFSLNYAIQADWELNMRLWGTSSFVFQYFNIPVAVFAEDGLSSSKQDDEFNKDYLMLIRNYFPWHVYCYRRTLLGVLSLIKTITPRSLLSKLTKLPIRL